MEEAQSAELANNLESTETLEQAKAKYGGVERLAVEANIYFVHSLKEVSHVRTQRVGERPTFPMAQWEENLAALVTKKPFVSASTVKYGIRTPSLWAPTGVFLKAGVVEFAKDRDTMTYIKKATGERTLGIGDVPQSVQEYLEQLEIVKAGSVKTTRGGYNEIGIRNPEIAGIYINLDSAQIRDQRWWEMNKIRTPGSIAWDRLGPGSHLYIPFSTFFDIAKEYGMKVFSIKDGVAEEAWLGRNGTIERAHLTPPEEMITEKYQIPEESLPKIRSVAAKAVTK